MSAFIDVLFKKEIVGFNWYPVVWLLTQVVFAWWLYLLVVSTKCLYRRLTPLFLVLLANWEQRRMQSKQVTPYPPPYNRAVPAGCEGSSGDADKKTL